MKYFTVHHPGHNDELDGELLFTRISSLKRYLKTIPPSLWERTKIFRHWWSRDDYVDCEQYTIEEVLGLKASQLKAGATMRWEYYHKH